MENKPVIYTRDRGLSISIFRRDKDGQATYGFVYIGTFRDVQLWINKFDAPEQMTWNEAMKWAKENKKHIPSIDELTVVYLHKDEINKALKAAGGEPLKEDDWYWSSSEYNSSNSWTLDMDNGYRGYGNKIDAYYVRSFQLI